MNKTKLFEIFVQSKCSDLAMFEKIVEFVDKERYDAAGRQAAWAYEALNHLLESENNAGHEERHSERIQYIWDKNRAIIDSYEEFLP